MSKYTPTLSRPFIDDGVLIRYQEILRRKQGEKTVAYAHLRAREIVEQAQIDAAVSRQEAYIHGYEEGVICAIRAVIQFLSASKSLSDQWHQQLHHEAQARLDSLFSIPEIFQTQMKIWLDELPGSQKEHTLSLLFPERFQSQHSALVDTIREDWIGDFVLDFHQENRFSIKLGDQLAEFSPERLVVQEKSALLNNKKIAPEAIRLSQESLITLQALFSQGFARASMSDKEEANNEPVESY